MASKTDSTKVMWRVQVRKSRNHAWKNKGLFETRAGARASAAELRYVSLEQPLYKGYGWFNTRVIKYVRGGGR